MADPVGFPQEGCQALIHLFRRGQSEMGEENPSPEDLDAPSPRVVDAARQPQGEIQRAFSDDHAGEAHPDHEDDARQSGRRQSVGQSPGQRDQSSECPPEVGFLATKMVSD